MDKVTDEDHADTKFNLPMGPSVTQSDIVVLTEIVTTTNIDRSVTNGLVTFSFSESSSTVPIHAVPSKFLIFPNI
jgi:hypothetical protein